MTDICVEMVVYRVQNPAQAADARISAMKILANYDGLISWRALESIDEIGLFVDIAEWQSHEHAKAANEAFGRDDRLKGLISSITEMVAMTHCEETGRVQG